MLPEDQAVANAKAIESEIQGLETPQSGSPTEDSQRFWAHVRHISEMFKSLKPLLRDDRARLWARFSCLCEEAKERQQKEREALRTVSLSHRDAILIEAEFARPATIFGFDPPDADELKRLGACLHNAGDMLSKCKHEMLGEHKQECFDRIQEIRGLHDIWWEHLRNSRSGKHEDTQQRIRTNLEENYERHRKASDALSRLRNHAEELREQITSAWSDDFRERAETWLSETEDKIRDIEQFLEKVEGWIREGEGKLR